MVGGSDRGYSIPVRDLETILLYRPVGPAELSLIADAGYRAFPPRLPEQPIFYPVLHEAYAVQIARDWNVKASGSGYVTASTSAAVKSSIPSKVSSGLKTFGRRIGEIGAGGGTKR